jgi:hypothetical protein
MSDTDVSINISGDASGAQTAFKQAADAAKSAGESINTAFAGLGKVFDEIRSHLGAFTAILAGGAAFKEAIDVTKEWGGEQAKLAKQLQITTEQAAAYQIAGEEIGVSGETIVSASDKLTKQLLKNEDAFAKVGIETRNSNGSYRSTGELMPEVIEHLRGLHNVTEQNTQGIALFGKAWTEVRGILKLSKESLAEAGEKAKELNLVVDPAQLKSYKAAMSDVSLIMKSVEIQVGNMLLPLLTKLGTWMGEVGPYVCGTFSIALRVVGEVVAFVYRSVEAVIEVFAGFAAVMMEFIQGNYKNAWNMAVDAADQSADKIKKIFTGIGDVWNAKTKVKGGLEEDDQGHTDLTEPKEKKDPTRVPQWDAELAELKLAKQEEALTQGKFYEMSKADEKDYWDKKLALTKSGTNENLAVRKKDAELGLAMQKDAFEVQLQDLKTQSDAFKNNLQEKIRLAEQEATIIGQKYGLESKEYKAAQGEIIKLKREIVAQEVELESAKQESLRQIRYSEINLDQEIANERLALGLITETEMLQLERKFEEQRTQIALSAQRARIAAMESDPDHSPLALQKEKDQLLQIEQQHALAVQKINGKIAVDAMADYRSMVQSIGGAFTSMFTSIATGQAKVGAAIKTMFTSVLQSAAEMIAQYLAKKAAAFAVETAMNSGFLSAKAGAELAALIAGNAAKSTAAAGEITASAGVAAAGGAAAMASIPYVGPILAAGAYADMMALGLSALPMASAAGGWDIPGNLNPIVQAHAGEMILPAAIAKRFRSAAPGDGEDGSGGGRGDVHHHYNVTVNGPQDKRSMERWMADLLPGATNRSQRSFGMAK